MKNPRLNLFDKYRLVWFYRHYLRQMRCANSIGVMQLTQYLKLIRREFAQRDLPTKEKT